MASDHTDTLETSLPRTTYPSKFHSTRLLGRPEYSRQEKLAEEKETPTVKEGETHNETKVE